MTNDVRSLFERTLPEAEPPASFSSDDIVRAGRRRVLRVRAAFAGTSVAAVAAVASLSFALTPGASAPATDHRPDSAAPPSPIEDDADVIAAELHDIIEGQGVTLEPGNGSSEFELAAQETYTGDTYSVGAKTFDRGSGTLLAITLHGPGEFSTDPTDAEVPDGRQLIYCGRAECVPSTTEDGDTVYTQANMPGADGISNVAIVFRADGTAVLAQSICLSDDYDTEDFTCDEPLSVDKLTTIVTETPDVSPLFEG